MADVTLDRLITLRERVFEAAYDETLWGEALGLLRSALSGSSVALGHWGGRPIDQIMIHSDCPPDYSQSFFEPELLNPFVPASARLQEGAFITDTSLMPRDEFRLTPIYNEWLRPQGEHSYLQCKLLDEGDGVAHLGMLRGGSQDAFGTADLKVLGQITPALGRAVKVRRRLGKLRLTQESETYGRLDIGLAIVGPTGRVLHRNDTMEAILSRSSSGLTLARGALAMTSKEADHRLPLLIAEVCRPAIGGGGDLMILSPETGAPSLALSITPVPDAGLFGLACSRAALILVKDVAAPFAADIENRLAALFGFTGREASLAIAIASGRSLQSVAEERGVSITTVRTQLARVFRKTSTSQQSQLVALVLNVMPICRGGKRP